MLGRGECWQETWMYLWPITCLYCHRKHKQVFECYIISQHWIGGWNSLSRHDNHQLTLSISLQLKTWWPGPWFNIKILSDQYRKSHCRDKMVIRSYYLHNGISCSGKTVFYIEWGPNWQGSKMSLEGMVFTLIAKNILWPIEKVLTRHDKNNNV